MPSYPPSHTIYQKGGVTSHKTSVKFVIDQKFLMSRVWGFEESVQLSFVRETADLARDNVAPGEGPSLHPHPEDSHHEDTGNLMRAITYSLRKTKSGFTGTVYVKSSGTLGIKDPAQYGLWLELGWYVKERTDAGYINAPKTYGYSMAGPYPWLGSAFKDVVGNSWKFKAVMIQEGKHWFTEAGSRKRIPIYVNEDND